MYVNSRGRENKRSNSGNGSSRHWKGRSISRSFSQSLRLIRTTKVVLFVEINGIGRECHERRHRDDVNVVSQFKELLVVTTSGQDAK